MCEVACTPATPSAARKWKREVALNVTSLLQNSQQAKNTKHNKVHVSKDRRSQAADDLLLVPAHPVSQVTKRRHSTLSQRDSQLLLAATAAWQNNERFNRERCEKLKAKAAKTPVKDYIPLSGNSSDFVISPQPLLRRAKAAELTTCNSGRPSKCVIAPDILPPSSRIERALAESSPIVVSYDSSPTDTSPISSPACQVSANISLSSETGVLVLDSPTCSSIAAPPYPLAGRQTVDESLLNVPETTAPDSMVPYSWVPPVHETHDIPTSSVPEIRCISPTESATNLLLGVSVTDAGQHQSVAIIPTLAASGTDFPVSGSGATVARKRTGKQAVLTTESHTEKRNCTSAAAVLQRTVFSQTDSISMPSNGSVADSPISTKSEGSSVSSWEADVVPLLAASPALSYVLSDSVAIPLDNVTTVVPVPIIDLIDEHCSRGKPVNTTDDGGSRKLVKPGCRRSGGSKRNKGKSPTNVNPDAVAPLDPSTCTERIKNTNMKGIGKEVASKMSNNSTESKAAAISTAQNLESRRKSLLEEIMSCQEQLFNTGRKKSSDERSEKITAAPVNVERYDRTLECTAYRIPRRNESISAEKSSCEATTESTEVRRRRYVVIDGSNVAMAHGLGHFSCKGIELAVEYFLSVGCEQVVAMIPKYRSNCQGTLGQELLPGLVERGHLHYTPVRTTLHTTAVPYDDRLLVRHAMDKDAVILSNDNYRDLAAEREEVADFIENRLLMFMFVGDSFMVVEDPGGRYGPKTEDLLSGAPMPIIPARELQARRRNQQSAERAGCSAAATRAGWGAAHQRGFSQARPMPPGRNVPWNERRYGSFAGQRGASSRRYGSDRDAVTHGPQRGFKR